MFCLLICVNFEFQKPEISNIFTEISALQDCILLSKFLIFNVINVKKTAYNMDSFVRCWRRPRFTQQRHLILIPVLKKAHSCLATKALEILRKYMSKVNALLLI